MTVLKKTWLAAALAVVATMGSANAVPITGMISINGGASYTSTSVSFVPNSGFVPSFAETGSFTVIGTTANVTLTNFTYNPTLSPAPVTVFSATNTAGTATTTFSLESIQRFDNTRNQLAISATGTLTLTGFDPTMGTFELSTQGPSGAVVTFSATASSVPEPGSIALVGAGLVAFGVARRRFGQSAT